ncbi:MAG: arginine--tRNA ligase, partial [Candidatus Moranbacteria bacterium CG_4_8_14_3_um_filter_43_15]
MKSQIQQLIQQAIKSAFGIDFDIDKINVDYPPEGIGDYSTNVALLLAKEVGKSPMEVAEELRKGSTLAVAKVEPLLAFEKIEVALPGFLNFYLSEKSIQQAVSQINKSENNFGNSEIGTGKKIHLDFVSANPTGPVHIGNARGGP